MIKKILRERRKRQVQEFIERHDIKIEEYTGNTRVLLRNYLRRSYKKTYQERVLNLIKSQKIIDKYT